MELQRTQPAHSTFGSNKIKKMGAISALFLTSFLYQNFSFNESWNVNILPLNENSRSAHARELLGNRYDGSPAQLVANNSSLGMAILNDVYRSLPKKHKSNAIDLASTILSESEKYQIDPVFVMAVIRTESSFNPVARGRTREISDMKLKPDTAEWIAKKFRIPWKGAKTLENPSANVRIGLAYFNYLRERFDGHAMKYLSAYNLGVTKVFRMYASDIIPQEYSLRVMKHYRETYKRLAAATTVSLLAGN